MANSVLVSAAILLTVATFAFFGIGFLLATLYIAYVHHQNRHLPGPPYSSFYLGHLGEIRAVAKKGFLGTLFLQWSEDYGPVCRMFILHKCAVWISGTAGIKEVLTNSRYSKPKALYQHLQWMCGARLFGHGLLTETDHYKWHKRRVVVNPAFHKKYLRMFMEQFNSVGDRWIETLRAVADGKTVFSMHEYLCRVTLDAIAEVGFNNQMNATERADNKFLVAILTCLQSISKSMRDPLFRIRRSESEFRKILIQSLSFLRSYGQHLLEERRSLLNSGQPVPEDILTYIIKCKEVDESLTDEDLLDDFITLFVAGQETTSNALSFLLLEVGRNQEVYQKIQDEVDMVMGSRQHVTYEDLSRLEYCGQTLKETLRLYPVAPGTSRTNPEQVVIDGHRIPPWTLLNFSFYVIQHLDKYYEDPEKFYPERFAPGAPRTLFSYMPFSIGQRSCVGQQFAQIEAKVLMCKFFKAFELTLDPNQSFDILEATTLRPKDGAMMSLTQRT